MFKQTIAIVTLLVTTGCAQVAYQIQGDKPLEQPETRTVGEIIDDNSLETKVKVSILQADDRFSDARIQVVSYNGKILLIGQVPDSAMKPMATEAADSNPTVRSVHNELTVQDNIGVKVRASDSWLGTKVKSRMFTDDTFPSRKIDVIVENGVVYLMGIVDADTAQKATELAKGVTGVQKVVTLFERPKT